MAGGIPADTAMSFPLEVDRHYTEKDIDAMQSGQLGIVAILRCNAVGPSLWDVTCLGAKVKAFECYQIANRIVHAEWAWVRSAMLVEFGRRLTYAHS